MYRAQHNPNTEGGASGGRAGKRLHLVWGQQNFQGLALSSSWVAIMPYVLTVVALFASYNNPIGQV